MNKKVNIKLLYGLMILFSFSVAFALTYAYFKREVKGNELAKYIDATTTTLELKYTDTLEINAIDVTPGWYITKEVSVENTGLSEVLYTLMFQNLINEIENNELVISATCINKDGSECESIEETPIMSTEGIKLYTIKDGILINSGEKHTYTIKLEFKETGTQQNYNQGKNVIGVLGIKESVKSLNTSITFEDDQGNAITNATIEIHSTPQTGTTNENGNITFNDISLGNHMITINTGAKTITQKIKLLAGNTESITDYTEDTKLIKVRHDIKDLNLKIIVNTSSIDIEFIKTISDTCGSLSMANCMINNPETFNLVSINKTATGNQNFDTIDYRYQGSNPNNYVLFNDQMWRILGVFEVYTPNGNDYIKEYRVKLVSETIGDYLWNSAESSGKNLNNWSVSTLMRMLNEGAYYNRSSAYTEFACSTGDSSTTSSSAVCDFTSTGLTTSAKNMINNVKWYLGTVDRTVNINEIYNAERSSTVLNGNPDTWDGLVGLMYPSDYLYVNASNYTNTSLKGNSTTWKTNNYLAIGHSVWTMSPHTDTSEFKYGVNYAALGYLSRDPVASDDFAVRPVVYLKSNIKVIDGKGTSSNPYIIN